jgi:hypothetical protein
VKSTRGSANGAPPCSYVSVVAPFVNPTGAFDAMANNGINLTARRWTAEERRLRRRLCQTR